jgi:hypothetical protein
MFGALRATLRWARWRRYFANYQHFRGSWCRSMVERLPSAKGKDTDNTYTHRLRNWRRYRSGREQRHSVGGSSAPAQSERLFYGVRPWRVRDLTFPPMLTGIAGGLIAACGPEDPVEVGVWNTRGMKSRQARRSPALRRRHLLRTIGCDMRQGNNMMLNSHWARSERVVGGYATAQDMTALLYEKRGEP